MKLTTHELARRLLAHDEVPFKFKVIVSNCGDSWYEVVDDFTYSVCYKGFVMEEDFSEWENVI